MLRLGPKVPNVLSQITDGPIGGRWRRAEALMQWQGSVSIHYLFDIVSVGGFDRSTLESLLHHLDGLLQTRPAVAAGLLPRSGAH